MDEGQKGQSNICILSSMRVLRFNCLNDLCNNYWCNVYLEREDDVRRLEFRPAPVHSDYIYYFIIIFDIETKIKARQY